ncbi:hypothetical protein LPJGGPFB_04330 [Ensifer adhaerens]|nr:hypothetical protein [Ensifer adhaerens]
MRREEQERRGEFSPKLQDDHLLEDRHTTGLSRSIQSKVSNALSVGGLVKRRPAPCEADKGEVLGASSSGRGRGVLLSSFLFCVLVPTFIVFAYSLFMASDVFVSEAKIAVRESVESDGSSQQSLASTASSILSKVGLTKSSNTFQNAMIVVDYVRSRAAVEAVGGRDRMKDIYGPSSVDWLSRLEPSEDFEDILHYWNEYVSISLDTLSNIITLRVHTFRPENSLELSQDLISKSEALINHISQRSRRDALTRASAEVEKSTRELADARTALLDFQQRSSTIDPIENAKQIVALVSQLTARKIEMESRLAVAAGVGNSERPGETYLRAQLDVVESQIKDLNAKLTGSKNAGSISAQLKDYELLKLRQEFAEQVLLLSRASYEEARRRMSQQQLYVVTVVPPMLPDVARYPRPAINAALVFLAAFVLWSIASLLVANIRDGANL